MFTDRRDAGRRLAASLTRFQRENPVIAGLPRGGVPIAFEVARQLGAPLDVIVVRKLGVPFQRELAMGAIGEDGVRIVDDDVIRAAGVRPEDLDTIERRERDVLERRAARYRADAPAVPLQGRTVIIVDDGVATGSTARAACQVARAHGAARVVLATPVASRSSLEILEPVTDAIVCLEAPARFYAVGQFYADFTGTTDDEVLELLRVARAPVLPTLGGDDDGLTDERARPRR